MYALQRLDFAQSKTVVNTQIIDYKYLDWNVPYRAGRRSA